MFERLAAFETRLEALDRQLMDPAVASDGKRMREVATEAAHVRDVVDAWRAHRRLEQELAEAKDMLAESDGEMKELARQEIASLEERLAESAQAIRLLLLPRDPYEGRPLVLEIRAGTGGDEAALFAGDLYRMYQRFGESRGLRFEAMSISTVTVGGGSGKTLTGYKEIIASVTGPEAYNLLRFEGGVHRVQRIPATEAMGRIHTSTATVAILPEPDEVEVRIEAKDLRIDTMRAGGPGGQSVNTTDSAVRVVHLPTGITVVCMDEKSQHKNKDKAMRVLKARLLEKEESERKATETAARREMVGTGDRSERIRTYNVPQNRLTDHRIGLTLYKLEAVLDGDLGELVDALSAEHQAKLLEAQDLA
jgi:peptide chain release factor 1